MRYPLNRQSTNPNRRVCIQKPLGRAQQRTTWADGKISLTIARAAASSSADTPHLFETSVEERSRLVKISTALQQNRR